MSDSLCWVLIHVVFSTKLRIPVLMRAVQSELHTYMGGTLNAVGCQSLQVGGVADHVHLLFALPRTLAIATVVERVKTASSRWLKSKDPVFANFHWQTGYGAFSVSKSGSAVVEAYIRNQTQHHRKRSFQAEYRHMLDRHQIFYDERYIWQ